MGSRILKGLTKTVEPYHTRLNRRFQRLDRLRYSIRIFAEIGRIGDERTKLASVSFQNVVFFVFRLASFRPPTSEA